MDAIMDTVNTEDARTLEELCFMLNKHLDDDTTFPPDLSRLPVFAEMPRITTWVFSCDESRVLTFNDSDGGIMKWVIAPRCDKCGEALFNCKKGNN